MTKTQWLYGGVLALSCVAVEVRAACNPMVFLGTTTAWPNASCGITVGWGNATGEGAITYSVFRDEGTGFAPIVSGLTGNSYLDSGELGFTYEYYILAQDSCLPTPQVRSNGSSPPRSPIGCPEPFRFVSTTTATSTSCGIDVRWGEARGGIAPITYAVFRDGGSGFVPVISNLFTPSYHDAVFSGSYRYYIVATDSDVPPSSLTNGTSGTVSPNALPNCSPEVTNVDLRCDGGVSVLSWDPAIGASGYNIYRGTLASLTSGNHDHANFGACNITGTTYTMPGDCTAADGFYFIVVGRYGATEGIYGWVDGGEIPAASPICP